MIKQVFGHMALLWQRLIFTAGTPGIIVMPTENATADNTTVIPGVVSEDVLQQAIVRAGGN
ncbi:hypothetical protein [Pantoea sp. Cy-640]|uniref:hypothetical protein n=1 Tax=Pantoea sp. Cy-640 TaxID=2608353 RepID=UPI00352C6234